MQEEQDQLPSGIALRSRYDRFVRPAFLPLALVIFTASGFSGLIYQSIWSHYLKLFLGHAAYAQSLVLAIFMGGMALGSWLASRWSPRWRDLLLAYAVTEALIGGASLVFHDVFVSITEFSFATVIPALGSPATVQTFKWTLAAALILPQSVLLGMTFPLMTGGVLRMRAQGAGYAIAMLYFTNSLGAAAGVLASGFYFIEAVGLPGTLVAAAIANLAVAAATMFLPHTSAALPSAAGAPNAARLPTSPQLRLLLAVAAFTGMSSFMYEIGWIRMLSLVLGASTHAFELMLSAFILGIAWGGWWVRRRIDGARDTAQLLGWVQLVMGAAALATLPVYGSSFDWMQQTIAALSPTENGYSAFNLISHGICLAVMFPAAFCAGMTLPLITASLLRLGVGERAIGLVYAANTAGAILGVAFATHLAFTLIGLKGLIMAGAAVDLGLGALLLGAGRRRALAAWTASLAGAVLLVVALGVRLDAHDMASGVYRLGVRLNDGRDTVRFSRDGKSATVSVTETDGTRALRTNGKSDGAVQFGPGPMSHDEVMMTLVGALPQFLAPQARHVANIGFGTGITTHVLLASEAIERVDTVEIEPAMVEAGAHFRPRNARALDDPRSRIHYEDAKTFFSTQRGRYDVIVSEPSNPWVSGVAGLFSTEFYGGVRRYLKDGGLLVQWVQLYEMTPQLLATVMAALDPHFTDYELWVANHGDMIIVAAHGGRVPRVDPAAFANPRLQAELERLNIRNSDDLLLHRLGARHVVRPYFAMFGAQPHSDFFPLLDLKAPLARFMRAEANEVLTLWSAGFPVLRLLDPQARQPLPERMSAGERPWLQRAALARQAWATASYVRSGQPKLLAGVPAVLSGHLAVLRSSLVECRMNAPPEVMRAALSDFAFLVNQHLAPREARAIWHLLERSPCAARLEAIERHLLTLNAAVAAKSPEEMAPAARALLDAAPQLEREIVSRALAAYMVAQLLQKNDQAARLAFRDYRQYITSSPANQALFRLLLGLAEGSGPAAD